MKLYQIKVYIVTMILLLLLSACQSTTEYTFELPATATALPATLVPEATEEAAQETVVADEASLSRICLVVEEGMNEENNYWNDIRQGIKDIVSDYGVEDIYSQGVKGGDIKGIEQCLAEGAKIVLLADAFVWGEVTLAAAQANPEIYFIGVDHAVDASRGPPNYVGIQFREDEAGFLMGYLAGLVTESNVVAGLYGIDSALLRRFRNGYEQGVKLAAEEREQEIELLGIYLDSFEEPEAGAKAAQAFIDAGADVIFAAAGTSGNGAILHAAQQGVYVIGANQDQYLTVFEGGEIDGADKIISSALKRVNVSIFNLLSILLEGNLAQFPGGSNYMQTIKNGGLTFANPHDADIPAEFYDKVAELEQALAKGEHSTGVDFITGNLLSQSESATSGTINKVCLVAHDGLTNDGGFFQYIYEGMQVVATEQAIEGVYLDSFDNEIVETYNDPRMITLIEQCLDTGAEVVITSGFTSGDATMVAAEANPTVFFIGVDHFVQDGPPNYAGIQARDDEAGFLAGYLAGWATKSNVVAGVYGPNDPPIKRFRNGYEQGVALAAQERGLKLKTLGIYLDSYQTPELGAEAAQAFIDEGADVIFGAAGRTGNGAILHAAAQGIYVIGVDQDEYFTTFEGGEVAGAERLISSALKRVDHGIISLLNSLIKAEYQDFPGGGNYLLTVANGGLTFANPHQADIQEQIYDNVAQVEQALAKGELETGVEPVTGDLLGE